MSLDTVIAAMEQLPPEERARKYAEMSAMLKSNRFIPNPGPQTDAYFHPASILLFGGSGGGGKTSLISGLSLTAHTRSLIMTRQGVDSSAICEEMLKMYGSRDGFVASPRPKLRTDDGRLIEFGSCQNEGDEDAWRGAAHDLKAFDEVTRFSEGQVRFIMAWNRTTVPGQRTRVVMASNPPTSSTGDWIIGYYRPWLDVTHHNPAKPGELRWFVTDPDGRDMEVDGPDPIELDGKKVKPISRTFIPSRLSDNPYLTKNDDYERMLDSLPEPLRSAMRDGNFMLARKDGANQVIPTEWVRDAMKRWHDSKPSGIGMSALGVDIAQGGGDRTILAPRYDGWFDTLVCEDGKKTPTGLEVAALVVKHRRNACPVVLDMGGGYGGATLVHLKDNEIETKPYKGSEGTTAKDISGQLGFFNTRSKVWWQLREALDPSQPGGSPIALPDDQELLADLTAPTYEVVRHNQRLAYKVEEKTALKKRLGRSPDRGDAVCMAWAYGERGHGRGHPGRRHTGGKRNTPPPKVIMGRENRRR